MSEPAEMITPTVRPTDILMCASTLVDGDRRASYGDARESFDRLAALWSATLGVQVTSAQVALCLTQLKISRLCVSPDHLDSWIDLAGYAALGGYVADTPPASSP